MAEKSNKPENPLNSILLNVVIPVVVLTVFSKEKYLGPLWGLVVALVAPVVYGLRSLIKEGRPEFVTILGVVSVVLTGVFGLLKLAPEWIAWKEASIPLLLGIAIVISLKTPYPLIKKILLNDKLFKTDLLHERLKANDKEAVFEKRLVGLTWGLASSMFLSSILNFGLAKVVLKSEPGSEAFAAEIGKMTGLSYIVVMIPSMLVMILVLFALVKTITSLTGLSMDDMLVGEPVKKDVEPSAAPEAGAED